MSYRTPKRPSRAPPNVTYTQSPGCSLIYRPNMWRAISNASNFGGASVWYLYFKPNVAAYFRGLKYLLFIAYPDVGQALRLPWVLAGDAPALQFHCVSNSSTNRGNATAAGSRIRWVANRDKDVSSGFTSTSSPLLAMARSAQSMMYPNVAVVPMTRATSQAPSSRKFSTR